MSNTESFFSTSVQQQTASKPEPGWPRAVALTISFLCFLVGFWAAREGLENELGADKVLYSWGIAVVVLLSLSLTYMSAVEDFKDKGRVALLLFMLFAAVTFSFNLNAFLTNNLAQGWIKTELNDYIQNLDRFKSNAEKAVSDLQDGTREVNARLLLESLVDEVKAGGVGPKARKTIGDLQGIYNINIRISSDCDADRKLSQGKINECITQVEKYRDAWLRAKKVQKSLTDQQSQVFKSILEDIQKLKSDSEKKLKPIVDMPIEKSPERLPDKYQGEFINPFRRHCDSIYQNVVEADESAGLKVDVSEENVFCKEKWFELRNEGVGKIGFLFSDAIYREGTGFWIFIALLIDFIIPLSLYLLVYKREKKKHVPFFSKAT
jgi:hypothetical protein